MKKKTLLGILGVAGITAAVVKKRLSEAQKEELALKMDEAVLNGREKALNYYRHAEDLLDESSIGDLKTKIKNAAYQDALAQVQAAKANLKEKMATLKEVEAKAAEEAYQDDIVIDGTIFDEFYHDHPEEYTNPTEVFYPKDEAKKAPKAPAESAVKPAKPAPVKEAKPAPVPVKEAKKEEKPAVKPKVKAVKPTQSSAKKAEESAK